MKTTVLFATLSLVAALPAAAEVYRCSAANKPVSYQEQPCDSAALEDRVAIPTQFPDHVAARNRLDAREAAADARILERLKVESAERIARDDRAAREATLAADRERDQARAGEGWYPVYAGTPVHAPRVRQAVKPHARHRIVVTH